MDRIPLVRRCAWCPEPQDDDPETVLRTTHGICADCAAKLEAEYRESRKHVLVRVDRSMPFCQVRGGL